MERTTANIVLPIYESEQWARIELPLPERAEALAAVEALMEQLTFEIAHVRHATRLALALFDALQPIHQYGALERFWLQCGALLHDIGFIEGSKGHHKTALRIILNTPLLPLTARERLIAGSIARYHRRAVPSLKHDHFAALSEDDRQRVRWLGGILRVADAADYSHEFLAQGFRVHSTDTEFTIALLATGQEAGEWKQVHKKGDLLEEVIGQPILYDWERVQKVAAI